MRRLDGLDWRYALVTSRTLMISRSPYFRSEASQVGSTERRMRNEASDTVAAFPATE